MIKESQKEITCLGFIFFILTFRYIHPYTIFKVCFRLTFLYWIYIHFPKAENDSTHTKRRHQNAPTNSPPTQDQDSRNIRTHQSTLQKSRQDRTTDHGSTSHQTSQPTSEQSAVGRYPHFTYNLIVMYTAPNLFFFSFSFLYIGRSCLVNTVTTKRAMNLLQ